MCIPFVLLTYKTPMSALGILFATTMVHGPPRQIEYQTRSKRGKHYPHTLSGLGGSSRRLNPGRTRPPSWEHGRCGLTQARDENGENATQYVQEDVEDSTTRML